LTAGTRYGEVHTHSRRIDNGANGPAHQRSTASAPTVRPPREVERDRTAV